MMTRWANIRFEATRDVVGVLVTGRGVDISTIELLVEHFLGVLLGLLRCVCSF